MTSGSIKEELALIRQLKSGRLEAAGELMDRHGETLMHYLYSILGSRENAEDAFQETWLKVMEKIQQFQSEMSFAPWLFRIARNTAYDALRSRQRWWSIGTGGREDEEESPTPEVADPTDFREAIQNRELVNELLAKLEPVYREALWLRYFQDLSYEEIAAFCRLPLGTVKSRLKRALDSLARTFRSKG